MIARAKGMTQIAPMTVICAALLIALKLIGFSQALLPDGTRVGTLLNAAQAEPAPGPAKAKPVKPEAAKSEAGKSEAAKSEATAPGASAAMQPPAEPAISTAERQLLQDLRTRRAELDARERTLVQRETVLDAAERRLTGRMTELAALQQRLEQLDAARHEHDEANWNGLVKVYETMKPREAATIFNDMEMPVLLQVMDRMKDAKAATILGNMQPDRARLVTTQLAAQRTHSTTVPPEHAGPG